LMHGGEGAPPPPPPPPPHAYVVGEVSTDEAAYGSRYDAAPPHLYSQAGHPAVPDASHAWAVAETPGPLGAPSGYCYAHGVNGNGDANCGGCGGAACAGSAPAGAPSANGGANVNATPATDDALNKELTRKAWLASEDQLIMDSVQSMGFRWRVIAGMLPGRSDDAVRTRWTRLQEAIRDGSSRLATQDRPKAGYKCSKCGQPKRNHVCTFQPGSALAPAAPAVPRPRERCSSAGADGEKLRVSWSKDEDETIRMNVSRIGPRWSLIAAELPGRTEHAVRNRWHRLLNLANGGESAADYNDDEGHVYGGVGLMEDDSVPDGVPAAWPTPIGVQPLSIPYGCHVASTDLYPANPPEYPPRDASGEI